MGDLPGLLCHPALVQWCSPAGTPHSGGTLFFPGAAGHGAFWVVPQNRGMCGRYAIGKSGEDLAKTLGVHFPAFEPAYSLAITNSAPVVRERLVAGGELQREGALLRWGVPDPAPERLDKPMQNARLSSIHYFDVWKNLYRSGMRAAVPMSVIVSSIFGPRGAIESGPRFTERCCGSRARGTVFAPVG